MQVTGMLHGAKLLQFAGFPTSEVLGPAASEGEIKDLISRHGSVFIKPVFKGGVGKKGKAGLLGRAKDLQTRSQGKRTSVFRRTQGRQQSLQGKRRDLRGRRSGRARGLFLHLRLHPLPRPDHDAHPSRRCRYRGAGQEPGGEHPLRSPDRPQGLRRRQRPDRAERAQADHLAAGSAAAQALGAVPQLRHDHARAEPDPHAPGSPGPADAGRLRLQVRLRPG